MNLEQHEKWPAIGLVHLALDCIGMSTINQIVEFLNEAKHRITPMMVSRALHQLRFEREVLALIEGERVRYRLRRHG